MNATSILLIFGFVLAIAIAGILWSLGQRQRRAQRLKDMAYRLGLSFEQDGRSLLNTELGELLVLAPARMNNFEVLNLMRGQFNGCAVAICDYHYWSGVGSDREDYHQTIFCFQMASSSSPDFALRSKLGSFETKIVDFAAKLAHLDFPIGDSGTSYWVEKKGKWVAACQRNMTVKPDNLQPALQEAFSVCQSLRDSRRNAGQKREGI